MRKILVFLVLFAACVHHVNGQSMPYQKAQWFTNAGVPAAGYKLCTYAAGTMTPQSTFATSTDALANTNAIASPRTLDSAGRADIFLSQNAYKFTLYTPGLTSCATGSGGTALWTEDNIMLAARGGAGFSTTIYTGGASPSLEVTVNPFIQLDQSYTGGVKSAAGTVALRNNAGVLEKSENGGAWGGIGGGTISGTTGTIPVFTSSSNIGNSRVTEDEPPGCVAGVDCVLKVNERLLVNGILSDVTTGSMVSLGKITEANSPADASTIGIVALGGGSGRAFLDSSHTGMGSTKPIALSFDGSEAVLLTTDSFLQITSSYTGATKSAAGTVAIRNNAGVLESSQNAGAWAAIAAGGTVTNSSSAAPNIPVFSSATNIQSSMLSQPVGPFLQLNTSYTGASLSSAGTVALRNNAGVLEASQNGGAWAALAAGGTVTNSSSSSSFIPVFSSATNIQSSMLSQQTGPFLQLNTSYTGGTLSSASTVALRNNAGVLEVSQNAGAWTPSLTAPGVSSGFLPLFSGTPGVLTTSFLTQPAGPFLLFNTSYTGGSLSSAGTVALRNNAGALEKSENGGAWTAVGGGGTIGGSGTATFLAEFNGAFNIGNSTISETSGAWTVGSSQTASLTLSTSTSQVRQVFASSSGSTRGFIAGDNAQLGMYMTSGYSVIDRSSYVEFQDTGSVTIFKADGTNSSTSTNIYVMHGGTLQQVTLGATDSGGTGFRVLRVPN